jgi:hypothetical protein
VDQIKGSVKKKFFNNPINEGITRKTIQKTLLWLAHEKIGKQE